MDLGISTGRSTQNDTAPGPFAPAPGTLRIGAVWSLPSLIADLGLALESVLSDSGIDNRIFSHPDNLVTYHQLGRLMLECERRSGCDHIGLLIGSRSRLANMGVAGSVALNCATVAEAIRSFADHLNLHDGAALVALVPSGDFVRFVYAIHEPGVHGQHHFHAGSTAIAFNILQELCGPDWLPREVRLTCREPVDTRPYRRFFRAPIRFDSEECSLVFDRSWLDRARECADAAGRRQAETAARGLLQKVLADLPTTVRRLVRKQLLLERPSMDEVARLLCMHRRTLDRQLDRFGTSYGEIVESVKFDVARQLLQVTDMPVSQIAASMHFSSAANFARAFRAWSGMSPLQYRARHR